MNDNVYEKFIRRWEEVTDLPPQNLGPLTPVYKRVADIAKNRMWILFLCCGICLVAGLVIVFGPAVSLLVSLLQRGF